VAVTGIQVTIIWTRASRDKIKKSLYAAE